MVQVKMVFRTGWLLCKAKLMTPACENLRATGLQVSPLSHFSICLKSPLLELVYESGFAFLFGAAPGKMQLLVARKRPKAIPIFNNLAHHKRPPGQSSKQPERRADMVMV